MLMEVTLSSDSDVHESISHNVLLRHPENLQPVKKRKRDDDEQQRRTLRIIEATTVPESRPNKPFSLVLIANLTRAQLPLAWLDSTPSTTLVPTRLIFHAGPPNSPHSQCTNLQGDTVLVVRQAPNGRLYAAESLGGNTYVGCLLAGWVTEEKVLAGQGTLSETCLLERLLIDQQDLATRENSFRSNSQYSAPAQPFRPSPMKPKNRRGVLARMSIMPPKQTTPIPQNNVPVEVVHGHLPLDLSVSQSTVGANSAGHGMPKSLVMPNHDSSLTSDEDQSGTLQSPQQRGGEAVPLDALDMVLPSAQTILETLHRQYLETLYTSKTSLAYFAKGPLVRAKSQMLSISASYLSDLADFYQDSIIPTKKMDVKYRDSIVDAVQEMALLEASGYTEEIEKASLKPKRGQKSGKQRKVGKDGLYPIEKEFIVSWWYGRALGDSDVPTAESRTREMKTAVADLRTRETEMQILLILETVALEEAWKATVADPTTRSLVKEEPAEQGQDATFSEVPYFKKRKRHCIRSELDLLVDRLCIWQTIGFGDTSKSSDEQQKPGKWPEADSKDRLRDFCSDVIIPFYSARLPEQCKAICQKLGGLPISPKRPRKTLQKALSSSKVLTGARAQASHDSISKRTLQRVLSEDQGSRHFSPPVLSRSSTAPLVPNLKRETTELPQRPESRGGLLKSRSLANREIDLVGDARSQDVKQKRLANLAKQKQEIDDAINALRKPNRGLAAREIADEMEKHRGESAKLTRPHGMGIQVDTTPKKTTQKTAEQSVSFLSGRRTTRQLAEPSVNEQSIPSSAMRRPMAGKVNRGLQQPTAVSDTPMRDASTRPEPLGLAQRNHGFEIFTIGRDQSNTTNKESHAETLIRATPSANRLRADMLGDIQNTPLRMKKSQKPVLFTAMKRTDITIEDAFKDAPEIPEQAGKTMARVMGGGSEMSIYDSLGWNDDSDD